MKKVLAYLILLFSFLVFLSFRPSLSLQDDDLKIDSLRKIYAGPISKWPKPNVDSGVNYQELAVLPPSPLNLKDEAVKKMVDLGRMLFFDPRLSESNQISCSSCHAPELNWADGREVSIGHDHAANKRNAPSLENVWFFKRLFWDGRAYSLEQQAESPVSSAVEMHQDMRLLAKKLQKIKGYRPLFAAAFGTDKITNERIFKSLADFQRTITSRKADFDYFLEGNKKALTDQQVEGLHLFRTKARCMNCHNGALFTDNDFHNVGLTYYGRKQEDLGLYHVTKKAEDVGKFKTPSLRNVMRTAPWFHNGLFGDMDGVLNMYNVGMPVQRVRPEQVNDPLLPKNDKLLKPLALTKAEKDAIVAFLHSISAAPWKDRQPILPK
jgi:cytochrome c peroxidase